MKNRKTLLIILLFTRLSFNKGRKGKTMINYYYYIEVKHNESIISPVSKVIIYPDDVPNMKYIPENEKEHAFAAYVYDIWTAYRNNKAWFHYTLRFKSENDCIHHLIGEHWTNSNLGTFYYNTYPAYKYFSSMLSFEPEQKEKRTA